MHSDTAPLLPPYEPQRQREIPVTKIQLKQLICTDISSRALERCTAEPPSPLYYPHSFAPAPSAATMREGHRGRLLIYNGGCLIKSHSWRLESEHELQNKTASINSPSFSRRKRGAACNSEFLKAKFFISCDALRN